MAEANTANSTLTTNFNVTPYFDDYNEDNNYYRILFKPGYAVQARELTQIQSILQKQVDRFGKHVFKEGSLVTTGNFEFATKSSIRGAVNYVKIKDVDASNNAVNVENFLDKEVTGLTTGITGIINFVLDGTESSTNTKTIYIDYTSASNSNSAITVFQPDEVLATSEGNLIVLNSNPTGKGSAVFVNEGVFFAKEHFIRFPTTRAIIDRYNDNPTCQIGFTLIESLVNSSEDSSLLDPALESSNYSAPGADRFKITPILTVRNVDDDVGSPDFVRIFKIKDGIIESLNDRPQYNVLGDEIAKRTFDESGHYFVEGLQVSLREHLDDGNNGGYSLSGNSQLLSVQTSKGIAYVQGYERELRSTSFLTTEKSTTYETDTSQLASASMGSYVTVNEFVGNWTHDIGIEIDLYDTLNQRITQKKWSSTSPTGKKIGTAKLMAVEYNTGTPGTANGNFDVYLSDVRMLGSNSFSNVQSLYYNNASTADMGADIVLSTSNTAVLKDVDNFPMLYATGATATKTLKPGNVTDTTFYYKKTSSVADISSGIFSVALPSGADAFPYGTSTLSSTQKREITLTVDADANTVLSGTITSNTGRVLTGSGTFFNRLNPGDKIEIKGITGTFFIESIASDTSLTLSANVTSGNTIAGNTYTKVYKTGDVIDLTTKGSTAGATRTVSATSSTLSFDLKETLFATTAATISYRVSSEQAQEIDKVLRPDRFVKIDCSSAGTTGPFGLGFSDVYKIKEIRLRRDGSAITSNTQGTDATSSFVFDNGQKDSFYDHATITPKISLTTNDRILVRLDYFYPDVSTGQGFFSIDSYPIDDGNTTSSTIKTAEIPIYKSPSSGQTYDLRNHLDFRPVKTATSSDSTTVAGASSNPSKTASFISEANGLRIPAPYSQISFDHEYYLARKDVVYMDKQGFVRIEKGVPSANPITPSISDDKMSLAVLSITPYPSISLFYGKLINRRDISCKIRKTATPRFTMRDIGVLKDRIINLENYVSLSLLEKNALDFTIQDENGLDRFKNGIFVDTFENHILGATYNPDYRIVVDPREKSIRPVYTTNSVYYDYLSGSNVIKTGDLVLLNYTEVPYFTQNAVTTTRNTERTTYRYVGQIKLTPEIDVWVDTEYAPDESIVLDVGGTQNININDPRWESDIELINGVTTEWGSWRQYVTGYKVYRGEATGQLQGTYSSLADAQAAANRITASGSRATVETLFQSERTGVQTTYGTDYDTYRLGDKVIDTKIIPYIRPQIIKVEASLLKPYARYYPYFDGIIMSNNVVTLASSSTPGSDVGIFGGATQLVANAKGYVIFSLSIPSDNNKRFTIGTKEVKLTDSPNNSKEDETSFALTNFFADAIKQIKQRTIISTRQNVRTDKNVSEKRNDSSTFATFDPDPPAPPFNNFDGQCIAYAFTVRTPSDEEGLFITSVDLFIEQKDPQFGFWVEILECDEAGIPIQSTVPFSVKTYNSSDVTLSTNGINNPFTVTFDSPVFLMKDKTYAFAFHPGSLSPNYYLWAARIGETDKNTGNQVNSRAYKGTTFTTNNGIIWQIVPDLDLTINIKRASFTTNVIGTTVLGNKPKEKIYTQNVSSRFTIYGEKILNGDRLTLSSITGGTVNTTDFIIGSNSAVNSSVISVGTKYHMSNTGYISGEPITVRHANGVSKAVTATISAIDTGASGILEKSSFDSSNAIIHLVDSNGLFKANDQIFTYSRSKTADIVKFEDYRYSVVNFEPSFIKFNRTDVTFSMLTYSNTGSAGPFVNIDPESDYYFTDERKLFSRSNEILSHSSNKTNRVQVDMSTTSNYISPVLDVRKTHSLLIDSIVNSNTTNETNSSGGELYNKYISKIVTLEENQDAEDMRIILTAYRPPTTDVKVWMKIKHAEDGDPFDSKQWIELERTFEGDNEYSSLSNKNDFKEFQYTIPDSYLTGSLGEVQYTQANTNTTFTGYRNFSIKIGLLADNSAVIPRVADLRVIALQI